MARAPYLAFALAYALLIPPIFIAFIASPLGKGWYDRTILPYIIDFSCSQSPAMNARSKVVPLASGRVLEMGIGSGINLPLYDPDEVTEIVGVDPSAAIQSLARDRVASVKTPVEMVPLELGQIGAPDDSFDDIVCTFTLCTIPDAPAALREMRRVLKPGGRLLFVEHGKAPDAGVNKWQKWLTPYWGLFTGGCHLDRDIPALIRDGGFKVQHLESGYLEMPKVGKALGYVFSGWAD